MFPFLPALILLLLNGPSGLDRPQHDAGLPEAIRALHRHVRQGSDRAEQKVRNFESDLVMASLIAASGDGELGKVVQELQVLGKNEGPREVCFPPVPTSNLQRIGFQDIHSDLIQQLCLPFLHSLQEHTRLLTAQDECLDDAQRRPAVTASAFGLR